MRATSSTAFRCGRAILTEANIGRNYLSDVLVASKTMPNGETKEVKWLQFKVPIRDFQQRVGGISDFRSIRFMRVFMKGWRQPNPALRPTRAHPR